MSKFSNRLELALQLNNMRARDLSNKTGLSEGTISQYRSGLAAPRLDRLEMIAAALNVSPEWLLGYTPAFPAEQDAIPLPDAQTQEASSDASGFAGDPAGQNSASGIDIIPDEEFIALACRLTPQQRLRVKDFMRGILA